MQHPIISKRKKPFPGQKLLDRSIVIIWGMFLAINTWTENLEQLLNFKSLGFHWVTNPNFRSFFYFYDLTLIHQNFIVIKLGHFTGFAIMDLLIYRLVRNHKWSVSISILFALLTELLQLFFGRDGRLYDLLIDSFGILSVYFLLKIWKPTPRSE